ncbi:MAG: hypothetical protein C4583_13710 [Anaerolineaceae bacterium]|nr:MAG: hypothetical protein C4583_13710 [Anaerolineaceae bacterium]
MNRFDKLYAEIWKNVIAEYGIETIISNPHEFGKMLDDYSRDAEKSGYKQLQPWLNLASPFISWITFFNLTVMGMFSKSDKKDKEFREFLGLISIISSLAASQAISIRKLCLIGQDASARIVLRSFVETTDIILMMIHDPTKRKLYFQNQTFDDARDFWNQNLRKSKLLSSYKIMFQHLGYPDDAASIFEEARENVKTLASQATHSSWHAAFFSAIPIPYSTDANTIGAFLGTISQFSKSTLFYLCESIWFLSEFGYSYLTQKYRKEFIEFAIQDERKNSQSSVPMIVFNLSSVIRDLYAIYSKEFHEVKDDTFEKMADYVFHFKE